MEPTQLPFSPLTDAALDRRTDDAALRAVWALHDSDDVARAREYAAEAVAYFEAAMARAGAL